MNLKTKIVLGTLLACSLIVGVHYHQTGTWYAGQKTEAPSPEAYQTSSPQSEEPSPQESQPTNLIWGNPTNANQEDPNNLYMDKTYFVLSYNANKGIPNWVAWRLDSDDSATAPRGNFYPDKTLPAGITRISPTDYTRSGFDRGHMCPHDDRSFDEEASKATFVMTNIMPQAPNLNRDTWFKLEQYCRAIARHNNVLYILAGGIGQGGVGENGPATTIGAHHVEVPKFCWKVILILDETETLNENTELFAVLMPNDQELSADWKDYKIPVSQLEKLLGFTFFPDKPELNALK